MELSIVFLSIAMLIFLLRMLLWVILRVVNVSEDARDVARILLNALGIGMLLAAILAAWVAATLHIIKYYG